MQLLRTYFKQGKYLDEDNKKSGNYCKWLMDKVLTQKKLYGKQIFGVT